jgi:hypothetical protein
MNSTSLYKGWRCARAFAKHAATGDASHHTGWPVPAKLIGVLGLRVRTSIRRNMTAMTRSDPTALKLTSTGICHERSC